MLKLKCPNARYALRKRNLSRGAEAHLKRLGPGSGEQDFADYLSGRKNPRGLHFERWCHAYGCGKWFHAARCTVTLEVFGTYSAQASVPPAEILAKIKARRAEWEGFA